MNERFLIKNTTREQREDIVREALGGCEASCEDTITDHDWAFYQPYIDGEMELRECTLAYRTNYVRGDMMCEERSGCGMGR